MSVTFVSAFLKIADRDPTPYIDQFEILAKTGVDILLFLDEAFREIGETLVTSYSNVRIPEYVQLDPIPPSVQLPSRRNPSKDTAEYLMVQLSKLKFLSKALRYTDRPYLAWIDFRIFHVLHNRDEAILRLKAIEQSPPITTKILAPGCWTPRVHPIWDSISWRFCGGFLLGHRDRMYEAYKRQSLLVAKGLPNLTWEVNYWTQMEEIFEWYPGDHNNTILPKNGPADPPSTSE